MSLLILGSLVNGFGWALVIVFCSAAIAFLYRDELVSMISARISYDGLEVEEIAEIEEARAELARLAKARAEKARKGAESARYEALAARAFYVPAWVAPWESVALDRLAKATIGELTNFRGVGPARARRIVDKGDSLSLDSLRRILTRPVSDHVLRTV
jgi:hypothetical protein